MIPGYLDSLVADEFPFWLVIFPEGTTIHTEYVAKSQTFAARYVTPRHGRFGPRRRPH